VTTVHVRVSTTADHDFVIGMVPRLFAFGPPPLRPAEALHRAERQALERALAAPSPEEILLVAELEGGPAGIAYAETAIDYFTREPHGHLAILSVAESGEGQGVGRALMTAVEAWARKQGYRFITLNVFAGNGRARAVYERAGYEPDTIRYVKELSIESADSVTG
jgi:GNAT superfamily N-acetyltransferase